MVTFPVASADAERAVGSGTPRPNAPDVYRCVIAPNAPACWNSSASSRDPRAPGGTRPAGPVGLIARNSTVLPTKLVSPGNASDAVSDDTTRIGAGRSAPPSFV